MLKSWYVYINEWDSIYKFYIFSRVTNISNVWFLIRKNKIKFDILALIISIFRLNTEFNDRKYMRESTKYFIIIIMYISSNYLIVSGEQRVHFNTNVCSRFCCTPRPFQAYGYPLLLLYMGGFGFHPSLSTGVCA